jgi:hypothetical protein
VVHQSPKERGGTSVLALHVESGEAEKIYFEEMALCCEGSLAKKIPCGVICCGERERERVVCMGIYVKEAYCVQTI